MIGTKDGRADGRRRLYGFAKTNLVALALGATLCGASVLAQAPPGRDVAPAAEPPPVAAAPVAPPEAASATGARTAARAEPPAKEPKSPPHTTDDALLPSTLPRDLSPWGMILSA